MNHRERGSLIHKQENIGYAQMTRSDSGRFGSPSNFLEKPKTTGISSASSPLRNGLSHRLLSEQDQTIA